VCKIFCKYFCNNYASDFFVTENILQEIIIMQNIICVWKYSASIFGNTPKYYASDFFVTENIMQNIICMQIFMRVIILLLNILCEWLFCHWKYSARNYHHAKYNLCVKIFCEYFWEYSQILCEWLFRHWKYHAKYNLYVKIFCEYFCNNYASDFFVTEIFMQVFLGTLSNIMQEIISVQIIICMWIFYASNNFATENILRVFLQ
jgi:hypothetical protein